MDKTAAEGLKHRAACLYRRVFSNNEAEQQVFICLHYFLSGLTDFKDWVQVKKNPLKYLAAW